MKLLFVLLPVFWCTDVHAQEREQALVDSLLRELPRAKEDTDKLKLLNTLSYTYRSLNTDEGIKYGRQQLELAEKTGNKKRIANAYNNIGLNYHNGFVFAKALEYYSLALKVDEELNDKQAMGVATMNMGSVYLSLSDYPRALEHYFSALKLAEEAGDKIGIARNNLSVGTVYYYQKDHRNALEYYFKAQKAYEAAGNKQGILTALSYIGNAYLETEELSKSLEYYLRALKMAEEVGDRRSISSITGNIGIIYKAQGKYADAISSQIEGLRIAEEVKDKFVIAGTMANLAESYIAMVKDTSWWDGSLSKPGKYQPTNEMPRKKEAVLKISVSYLERALVISRELSAQGLMLSCYENLAEAYKLSGNYQKAMEDADIAKAIKDSVFTKEKNDKIIKIEMQRAYDKKAAETQKENALKLLRQKGFTYAGIAGVFLLVCFSFFIIRERKKSDRLLLNILPSEIASELKSKGATKAKQFDNVTVLFTDFVNFTHAGERMSPQELIDELHNCFKAFDEIIEKYNIEKIKTIGDAYLAVAGLPSADPLNAEHVVQAAAEIRTFMNDRFARLGEKTFAIRIGIHSGSVIAGIVGVKKFAYDIWGDTVNTAARMEQNSETGKINISETTYELVKDKVACQYRGEIDVKNKGRMKMYFVS